MLSGIVVMQVFYGGKDKERRREKRGEVKQACLSAGIHRNFWHFYRVYYT